jgi:type I restriction enzyme S subunit
MKTTTILSSWLPEYSYRLDTKPYVGGVLEAKLLLRKLKNTVSLHTLTKGFDGGIYNGPKFPRTYVDSPEHGVPFLGSSSMLRADLSNIPLLSRKQAEGRMLRHLELKTGMSLISCSGTIGRMVYTRREMLGMWSSQHILKVVADPEKIPSGYLHAYLSSKFGVPLVVSGTYGSIIQSIGPEHIAGLPVPRFGDALEHEIHTLVEEGAELLTEHSIQLANATKLFFECVGLQDITSVEWHKDRKKDLGFAATLPGPYSLRSINYSPRSTHLWDQIQSKNWKPLSELCVPGKLGRGGRYTRVDADPEHGYELIGQRELFYIKPEGRWVARTSVGADSLLEEGTIAIAAQGTLGEGEVYCRAQFVCGPWTKYAFSEHILRVVADDSKILPGCLFAFLRSETAFRMLRSITSGSKQQDNHYYFLPRLPIPVPKRKDQEEVHRMVVDAFGKHHRAVANQDEAVALIEKAIDAHGK